jgi:prepilin-type N-terminal cleavage/methylation domain-containing protein
MMIRALAGRLRTIGRDQRGMTLVELMVSVSLMAVVATIFTTMLLSIQEGVIRQQARSEINDQARLALEQMDREIRSGSVLYDPEDEPNAILAGKDFDPFFSVRVFTQANAPTRSATFGGDGAQCVQWVIDDNQLFRRAWLVGEATSLSGWRMIAEGVVNREPLVNVPAFSLPNEDSDVLDIALMLNSRYGSADAPRTVRMDTSVAIRNAGTGDPCSPIPTS